MSILNKKAAIPIDFDVDAHFKHCFGIICDNDHEPQTVLLSFTSSEAKYIKSLALHPSQKIIKETTQETVFELFLYPTYDFVMELLSFGTEVTVLKPESLRKEIRKKLQQTLKKYD